ncbi:MAG TPA: glutamine synthetase family protein [Hyphomicrobiaceae bacterium]|nr:glutamine synthetase family protein [Hyphomicrobiaceae bacterium]
MARATFLERFAPWSDRQAEAAARTLRLIEEQGLEVVRVAFPDQHGLLRGKTLIAGETANALHNGCNITSSLFAKDTANRTVFPVWTAGGGFGLEAFEGAGDVLMLPDPSTFRVLPWARKTGWLLADVYLPDGRPVPYATRNIYRSALSRLAAAGYDYVAGLEVEFHVFKLDGDRIPPEESGQPGTPPPVSILTHGYQYLSELRFDQFEPVIEIIRREIVALGLPLRSVECEYGPSQCEFTFQALSNLEPADTMVLFRSAVKQICRRRGLHATFMCRPRIPNVMSSGWHLHQSIVDKKSGANAFMAGREGELLSETGRHFLGGLLDHARAASVFATPTLNGYKRFRSHSLAPDRAVWGHDNRGVMVRVLGGAGDAATRLENRAGEPAANPYLYMASQILAGLDGIERRLDPGPSADAPYDSKVPFLPKSLGEAVAALRSDTFFRDRMGTAFIDYLLTIKDAEIARFQAEVTDWEHREYFEAF